MYLLDTNICIALLKGNHLAVNRFKVKYQKCYLLTLVIGELYKGVYCSSRIQENLVTLERFIFQIPIVDFDRNAAQEFGEIQAELKINR
jgi:tRNA(fMet)-specific endonuclease VapC